MYADPPAPKDKGVDETPPRTPGKALDDPHAWLFNPEYKRLLAAWEAAKSELDTLSTVLDRAYSLAMSPQTWEAPVGERYVEDIREWRKRLIAYRLSVLSAISNEAADTPRWVHTAAHAPHAYYSR